MDDLHSLCRICHTNPPQYTCPRCSIRTCSLQCIQTHKRRAPCSGVRDPTVFKSMRQLATPAGIDHDYNFLSAIERSVERSDRLLVEEKGIVTVKELREGPLEPRPQFSVRGRGRGRGRGGSSMEGIDHAMVKGENDIKILHEARRIGVRIERLPKGMARQKLNGTSWSRKQRCVVWTVEWLAQQEGKEELETMYSKVLTTTPIGIAFKVFQEERRRAAMTPEEKALEKKRRAREVEEMSKKRPRREEVSTDSVSTSVSESIGELTMEITTAAEAPTSVPADQPQPTSIPTSDPSPKNGPTPPKPKPADPHAEGAENFVSDYTFYIRRPHTPSNLPTVLIPLDSKLPLDNLLAGKVIVEFPTIYVFPRTIDSLPSTYMLQDDFFARMKTGGKSVQEVEEGEVTSEEESSDDEPETVKWVPTKPPIDDSGTSSSGSSDESSEEESSDEEGGGGKDAESIADKAAETLPQQNLEMETVPKAQEEGANIPGLNMVQEAAAERKQEDTTMS